MPPIILQHTSCCNLARNLARRLIGGAALGTGGRTWGDYQRRSRSAEADSRLCEMNMMPARRKKPSTTIFCAWPSVRTKTYFTLIWKLFTTNTESKSENSCSREYKTLARAFHKEISPHIDQEIARRVLDTNWLPDPESKAVPQK